MTLRAKLKNKLFDYRLKRAIKKANAMYHLTAGRFFVMYYDGRPIVKAKKTLKEMRRKKELTCTIQHLEKIALYITP